jgi:arsenite methyltransferase
MSSHALLEQLRMTGMFVRELTSRAQEPRGPTPSEALGEQRILAAMEDGGRIDGRTAAGYLYHSARISRTIGGCATCVDLGCGTGVQLLQVATVNPGTHFVGVDRCPELLEQGAENMRRLGLSNVEWVCDDITSPTTFGSRSFDAAISTMTLHDLTSGSEMDACLSVMRRLIGTNGAIYIEDFARLRSTRSMEFFVSMNAPAMADEFAQLYRTSLSAAFTIKELREASVVLTESRLYSTFLVPFLAVIKTPDRIAPPESLARLRAVRAALSTTQRKDLDDLQRFFTLGGLRGDPFE